MSTGWSIFVTVLSILNVLACGWLIWWSARQRPNEVAEGEVFKDVWDEDLQERNNPMALVAHSLLSDHRLCRRVFRFVSRTGELPGRTGLE